MEQRRQSDPKLDEIMRQLIDIKEDINASDQRLRKLEARVNYLFGGVGMLILLVNVFEIVSHKIV